MPSSASRCTRSLNCEATAAYTKNEGVRCCWQAAAPRVCGPAHVLLRLAGFLIRAGRLLLAWLYVTMKAFFFLGWLRSFGVLFGRRPRRSYSTRFFSYVTSKTLLGKTFSWLLLYCPSEHGPFQWGDLALPSPGRSVVVSGAFSRGCCVCKQISKQGSTRKAAQRLMVLESSPAAARLPFAFFYVAKAYITIK